MVFFFYFSSYFGHIFLRQDPGDSISNTCVLYKTRYVFGFLIFSYAHKSKISIHRSLFRVHGFLFFIIHWFLIIVHHIGFLSFYKIFFSRFLSWLNFLLYFEHTKQYSLSPLYGPLATSTMCFHS